ncbi:homing endonuclease [Vibrio phage K469]
MNYNQIYDNLISRAYNRNSENITEDTEVHHILPKCLGGCDEPFNLVVLTVREHFIAHQILVKMYPDHIGIIFAATQMTRGGQGKRINNRMYGWLKTKFKESMVGNTNARGNTHNIGRKHTPESRDINSRAQLKRHADRPVTEETRNNMSRAQRKRFQDNPVTEETRAKQSNYASSRTVQHRLNLSKAQQQRFIDKPVTQEERKARSNRSKGSNSSSARVCRIVSPLGVVYEVVGGLRSFCTEHVISYDTIYNNIGKGVVGKARYQHRQLSVNAQGWKADWISPSNNRKKGE